MKKILAIVLSIAILVMAFPFGVFAAEPSVATDIWDGTTVEPTTTDDEGNIIINTAEELAWVALAGGQKTSGVNYKVVENSVFDLNGMSGITLDSTIDDVKAVGDPKASAYDRTNAWQTEEDKADATYAFAGNFDGNGLVVYNLFTSKGRGAGGLFPVLYPSSGNAVTIKNVTVMSSHIGGYHYAGGIVGIANAPDSSTKLTLEKCVVKNSYIYDNDDANTACQRTTGTLVGHLLHTSATINNCLVINNELSAQGIIGGLFGNTSQWGDPNKVTNVVSIGTTVEATSVNYEIKSKTITYSNVYTDTTASTEGITTLTAAQIQGDAAKSNMALAWNIDWLAGAEGEYPSINFGEPVRDPYVWDGTFKTPTETDAEGNIIINTVQEMAWVALRAGADTEGKNYKVADGVEYFDMNGSVGITADSSAEDVKAASATGINWNYASDSNVGAFRGNFDGNGVTIFNIRTAKFGHSALFPYILNESIIENVLIKASYFTGYHTASGIVGTGELQKTIAFNKCVVENCYFTDSGETNAACSRAAAGIIASTGNSNAKISNCLVVNNIFSAAGYEAGFVAKTGNYAPTGVEITNSIAIGVTPYSNAKIGELGKGLTEQLAVENVYSNVACDVAGFTTLNSEQMQGDAAKTNMTLAWNNDWLVGAEGEYPSINFGEPIRDPYVWDGTYKTPTETDAEGNIIINTASELAWIALCGGAETANKNYKVADGVKYFNMNGMEGITLNSTAEQVEAAGKARVAQDPWSNNLGCNWRLITDSADNAFVGNFDGNGIIIYNIYSRTYAFAGLFPCTNPAIQGTQTIKNVAVYASFMSGYHYSGGIVGNANAPSGTGFTMNFDNCATKNSYIDDMGSTHERTTGTIVGGLGHNTTIINNCLAVNNKLVSTGIIGGFFGNTSNYGDNPTVSNSLSIGSTIAPTSVGVALCSKVANTTYTNVYDKDVDAATLGSAWFNTTTYPELSVFHNIVNGKCEDCGIEVAGDPCAEGHTLEAVEGIEATNFTNGLLAHDKCTVCDKTFIDGVEKSAEELVIPMLAKTWNGNFTEPTTTDANGNIVINTPEELAWVALRGGSATIGKKYIVTKDSVFNLNGMTGITPFSTTEDVKAVGSPKADSYNYEYAWRFTEDNNRSTPFGGTFDGNGLIVYNLFSSKGRGAAGLFPATMTASNETVTIKNVTVMASHIGGYHTAGGIIGIADAPDTSTKLVIENCSVKNCYIYDNNDQNAACQRTAGTLVGNLSHNGTTINNCLVVDNDLSAQGIIGGLFGNSSAYGDAITVKNVISVGTSVQPMMVNYTINDKAINATYINVYTDQLASANGVTTLTTTQMQGAAAADNMNLNWGINWAVSAEGEYPTIIYDNSFYDEWDGSFAEPTKTDAEGNIIISTAEEMAWVALRGDVATTGKNYKVADGIKLFNMSGMAGITLNSTVNDVKNATKDDKKTWSFNADGKVGTFYGNFDGNGVTIYNIYTKSGYAYGGLFPLVKPQSAGELTIKNVNVSASYFGGYHNAGALIGLADAPDTSTKLFIENIIVKNSYVYDNNDTNPATQRTAGVVVGNLSHNASVLNNIFASGNEISAQGILGGLFGNTSAYASASTVSNAISIGTAVEPASVSGTVSDKVANVVYKNVYTDVATSKEGITTLTAEEMTGNKLTLDWSGWFATTDLPEIRAFHNVTSTDNGDGTHSDKCSECGLDGLNTPHIYEDGACALCGSLCVHSAADPVVENRVDATCMTEGSYDLVVYCSVCGIEISRTTETIETNPDAHTFDNDADIDCNNGCGLIRVNYGDSDGDGEINNKDIAMIMQYINGWNVEINTLSADVNCDGKVNNKDYALIMQYINGWDVKLG